MKKYDLYLFDFDGTLLDTIPALEYVFTVSYAAIGLKFDPKDTIEFSRIPLNVGYEKMHADPKKWVEFVENIDKSLDDIESIKRTSLYEETREFLDYLKSNKIRAGIVTSNNVKHVKEVLLDLDLPIDAFELFIGNKECEHFKPHPDPIHKALKTSKYTGELSSVVYIGDGMNDTISANAAGVDAVLIDRNNEFTESDKYQRIHNLKELFN